MKFGTKDNRKTVQVPALRLTGAGRELSRVIESTFRMDYLRSFSQYLREKKCEVSYARIIARHPDGSVTHSDPFVPIEPEPTQSGDRAAP